MLRDFIPHIPPKQGTNFSYLATLGGLNTAAICSAEQIKAPEDRHRILNSLGVVAANISLAVTNSGASKQINPIIHFIGGNIGEGLSLAKAIKERRLKKHVQSITKRDFIAFVVKYLLITVVNTPVTHKAMSLAEVKLFKPMRKLFDERMLSKPKHELFDERMLSKPTREIFNERMQKLIEEIGPDEVDTMFLSKTSDDDTILDHLKIDKEHRDDYVGFITSERCYLRIRFFNKREEALITAIGLDEVNTMYCQEDANTILDRLKIDDKYNREDHARFVRSKSQQLKTLAQPPRTRTAEEIEESRQIVIECMQKRRVFDASLKRLIEEIGPAQVENMLREAAPEEGPKSKMLQRLELDPNDQRFNFFLKDMIHAVLHKNLKIK
jgi:hypothetical protein